MCETNESQMLTLFCNSSPIRMKIYLIYFRQTKGYFKGYLTRGISVRWPWIWGRLWKHSGPLKVFKSTLTYIILKMEKVWMKQHSSMADCVTKPRKIIFLTQKLKRRRHVKRAIKIDNPCYKNKEEHASIKKQNKKKPVLNWAGPQGYGNWRICLHQTY